MIPRGTYLRIQAGELDAYNLPSVMNMRVGDRIVIRNEDDFPHILMYAFVPIGGTDVRVLDDVGTEVYTAGCTPSGGEFAPFTTIAFVGETLRRVAGISIFLRPERYSPVRLVGCAAIALRSPCATSIPP